MQNDGWGAVFLRTHRGPITPNWPKIKLAKASVLGLEFRKIRCTKIMTRITNYDNLMNIPLTNFILFTAVAPQVPLYKIQQQIYTQIYSRGHKNRLQSLRSQARRWETKWFQRNKKKFTLCYINSYSPIRLNRCLSHGRKNTYILQK
jgi:hypothetical protein